MIDFVVQTQFNNVWNTVEVIPTDTDLCPPQRILTRVLRDWIAGNDETSGVWLLLARDRETGRKISQSEEVVT